MFSKLERMRKRNFLFVTAVWIVATAAMIYLMFCVGLKMPSRRSRRLMGTAALIPMFIAIAIHKVLANRYRNRFKKIFYQRILKDDLISIEDTQAFSAEDLRRWGILPNVISIHTQDIIQGIKNGHSFMLCQLDAGGKERKDGPDAWFHGQYAIVDLKKAQGTIHVRTPENRRMEQESVFLSQNKELLQIKTEVAWFDDVMSVYTDHSDMVIKLLDKELMRKLMQYHQEYGNQLWLGFVDGQLHIAINQGKSFFQPSFFWPVNENVLSKQKAEVEKCLALIDDMTKNH